MDLNRPRILRLLPCAVLAVIAASIVMAWFGEESEEVPRRSESTPSSTSIPATLIAQPTPEERAAEAKQRRAAFHTFANQYCLDCHEGEEAEGELAIDTLLDSEPDPSQMATWSDIANAMRSGHMPPGDAEQPPEVERVEAIAAVESQQSALACVGDPDPGRVTIRRLTRYEYRTTIRDLVGIDFQRAADFPNDDVGYGFDNIGDVLSMPPLLLEKYLRAAERILDEAIVTDPTIQPELQYVAGEKLKNDYDEHAEAGWLLRDGEIYTTVTAAHAGKYQVRIFAAGQQAGPEYVRMGVKVDGQTIREFEVKTGRQDPQPYEVTVPLAAGAHRVAVEFLNDYWDADAEKRRDRDRNMVVQTVEVEGPFEAGSIELPATHRRIFFVTPDDSTTAEAAAEAILDRFASRAFRRPAKAEEVARLMKLVRSASEAGDTFEAATTVALSAVLVSPHFLFRIEQDHEPTEPGGAYRLSDYELASRLSYFLWSSMPDEELTELAAAGRLSQPEVLEAQVRRMLTSPKARALVDNFAAQWLQLRRLEEVRPDTQQFEFDEPLRKAMYDEVAALFETVMREDLSITELLLADYTFLNERLAKHYGLDGIQGDQLRRVQLEDGRRGGIVTTAAVLTVTSNPTRTSPVKRGKWISEQLLGIENSLPPDVTPLDEQPAAEEAALTLRERLARHTADASCAACHLRLDPLGFSLENYDAVGQWRERDGEAVVDASATMPDGTEFSGASGLKEILSRRTDEYVTCLARAMLTYALGRGLEQYDACAIQQIVEQTSAEKNRFSALVQAIVRSYPFQFRRILRKDEIEDE